MPSIRMTKRAVDAIRLPEDGKQQFYWDTELKGFGLRVGKSGKTFIVQRNMQGKTRRDTIGRYGTWTLEEARKEARERLLLMDKGVDIIAERREQRAKEITLEDAWKIHREALIRKKSSKRTVENFENFIEGNLSHWKKHSLATIR